MAWYQRSDGKWEYETAQQEENRKVIIIAIVAVLALIASSYVLSPGLVVVMLLNCIVKTPVWLNWIIAIGISLPIYLHQRKTGGFSYWWIALIGFAIVLAFFFIGYLAAENNSFDVFTLLLGNEAGQEIEELFI